MTHIETLRRIQHPVQHSHIKNLVIFWALAYLEPEVYLKPCETLTMHIQNFAKRHYSVIFRHIQNLNQKHMQKPGILGILEYSEPFHNCIFTHIYENVRIFGTLIHLKSKTSLELSQRFKMGIFWKKIPKNYNYFSKALHFRSLNEFWIRLSLNKYS